MDDQEPRHGRESPTAGEDGSAGGDGEVVWTAVASAARAAVGADRHSPGESEGQDSTGSAIPVQRVVHRGGHGIERRSQLAQRAGEDVTEVRDLAVWGNHSSTQFPDVYHATIGGRPAPDVIDDEGWLQNDFIGAVQQRGAAIIAARGQSSAASAANAVIDTVRNVSRPTGEIFSAAVRAPGDASGYGIPQGLVLGYPLRAPAPGEVEIVQGIQHGEWAQSMIDATRDELLEEREAVKDLLP